jgi:hypothetical protein
MLGAALALAACSSGTGSTAVPATSTGESAGPVPSATAGSVAGGTVIDPCTLLTNADIKDITGYDIGTTNPAPADTVFPTACEWKLKGTIWQISLGVTPPGGSPTWDSLVPYTQGKAVSGIGDKAFVSEMGGDLMVLHGGTFFDIQYVASGEPKDIQSQLAQRVVEHLP